MALDHILVRNASGLEKFPGVAFELKRLEWQTEIPCRRLDLNGVL